MRIATTGEPLDRSSIVSVKERKASGGCSQTASVTEDIVIVWKNQGIYVVFKLPYTSRSFRGTASENKEGSVQSFCIENSSVSRHIRSRAGRTIRVREW